MHLSHLVVAATSLVAAVSSGYAPVPVSCPATALVRTSTAELSKQEESYRVVRKIGADLYLRAWLLETLGFFSAIEEDMPTIGLTSSGGGFRAMLIGAGVVQALDGREDHNPVSGLYQALSYHSGLSGGSWLLSSIAGNDWPKISTLINSWIPALANGLFGPGGAKNATIYDSINKDLGEKTAAGFSTAAADAWSRLLSWQLLPGANGGVDNLMSDIPSKPRFLLRTMPYPIITALAIDLSGTLCAPPKDAPHYEFTPYEFGSWAPKIGAFTPTKYLGSSLSAGKPVSSSSCFTKYDNLGFTLGTSSALFNDPGLGTDQVYDATFANFCTLPNAPVTTPDADAISLSAGIARMLAIPNVHLQSVADLYASWPNPFYKLASASQISAQKTLSMADGGESGQINPIFPMLLPSRKIDVIIVSDNTDGNNNFPSGQELVTTYEAAKAAGMTRMPYIPPFATFAAQKLTTRPVFFGCHNDTVATIVWVPNAALTPIGGNTSTNKMVYSAAETTAMVANGAAVMSQNNSAEWAKCLGCAFMDKSSATGLPAVCAGCFTKYCVYP